jgi:hypothetical protein
MSGGQTHPVHPADLPFTARSLPESDFKLNRSHSPKQYSVFRVRK